MRASGQGMSYAGEVGDARGSVGAVGKGQTQGLVWSKEVEGEMSSKSSGNRGCWEPSSTHPVLAQVTSKSTGGSCVTS